jgi:hypothetical protein
MSRGCCNGVSCEWADMGSYCILLVVWWSVLTQRTGHNMHLKWMDEMRRGTYSDSHGSDCYFERENLQRM